MAELDDGLDDGGVLRVDAEPADERSVDLDRLDREPLQVGQRRVPGAEVVDGEVQAEVAQLAQRDRGGLDIAHQRRLGDLQPQRVGGEPALGQGLGDRSLERRAHQLAAADVDGDGEVGEARQPAAPLTELRQRRAQHGGTDLADQTGLLGHRQELLGPQQTAVGVPPPGQHLEADEMAGVERTIGW